MSNRKKLSIICIGIILAAAGMIFVLPQGRNGAMILCNRIFEASEAGNTYIYQKFPVGDYAADNNISEPGEPGGDLSSGYGDIYAAGSTSLTAVLLIIICLALLALLVISLNRALILACAAAAAVFQIYFGISFPVWINIVIFVFLAALLTEPVQQYLQPESDSDHQHAESEPGDFRKPERVSSGNLRAGITAYKHIVKQTATFLILAALTALVICFAFPERNEAIEAASEHVRDLAGDLFQPAGDQVTELPETWMAAKHANMRSLSKGENISQTGTEYDILTQAQEQISRPEWTNYLKMAVYMLLSVLLVISPVLVILLLNRKKKALKYRKELFGTQEIRQAVCSIYKYVILLLEDAGYGSANLPFSSWTVSLEEYLGQDYADKFACGTKIFEEAVYSDHELDEGCRNLMLSLLQDTEQINKNQRSKSNQIKPVS